jgi:hypothetical protein
MAMANENTNPLVAYAEARIAAWQAVLASLKSALTLDPGGLTIEGMELSSASATQGGDLGQPIDLPEGAFHGKSVPACIELYLSAARKKKTNKEIVDALREGGVESNSKLDNTVNAALFKLKSNGVVLRFKDGWGLSSWYPAHIRAVTPSAPKRAKKKAKAKKSGQKDAPTKATADSAPVKGKVNDRIIQFLQAKPEREHSLEAIAEHLGMGVRGARLSLGKLLKVGRVKMSAPGMYAIGRPQLIAAGA